MRTQAQLLTLNRSGLYYQPVPPSAKEVACKHRIDEIYTAHPYGVSPLNSTGKGSRSIKKRWHAICRRWGWPLCILGLI